MLVIFSVLNWSLTHFVCNIRHQHRCSHSCCELHNQTKKGLSSIWADLPSQNVLKYEDFKEMHLKFCKSFKNRENKFCLYDGDGSPDLPPGWQKLIELRYEQSMGLCNQFYKEFHNVTDLDKIHNSYIANGAQG